MMVKYFPKFRQILNQQIPKGITSKRCMPEYETQRMKSKIQHVKTKNETKQKSCKQRETVLYLLVYKGNSNDYRFHIRKIKPRRESQKNY